MAVNRAEILEALVTKDHPRMNRIAIRASWAGEGTEWSRVATVLVRGLNEDLRHFWLQENCPCGGRPDVA